jgi:glutathione S-transferase
LGQNDMIIYGAALSPFVRKVLAVAAEKGLTVELKSVGLGDPNPEFRAASPFGKMPALRDGDFTLADSSAIAHYLDAKVPEPALIPADPLQRGQVVWFDEFADTIFQPPAAKIFFNRVVAPILQKRPGDEAAAESGARELEPILDWLNAAIPNDDHLVGGRFTLADISVASVFVNLAHAGWHIDADRWPRLAAYVADILARPCLAGLVARENGFMARLTAPRTA